MRILVAEDDGRLADVLEQSLTEAGWEVELVARRPRRRTAGRCPAGCRTTCCCSTGCCPALGGRRGVPPAARPGRDTPVLMLTARAGVPDRISGLDAGADDYLAKPFDLDELLARLRALRRRATVDGRGRRRVGDLERRPARRGGSARGDAEIELSAREFDILHLLVERAGQVVTRFTILDEVWDGETDLRSNASTSTSPRSGPRSTGRSAPTRSPRCAASATGSDRSRDDLAWRCRGCPAAPAAGARLPRWRCWCCCWPRAASSTGGCSSRSTAASTATWTRRPARSARWCTPDGRLADGPRSPPPGCPTRCSTRDGHGPRRVRGAARPVRWCRATGARRPQQRHRSAATSAGSCRRTSTPLGCEVEPARRQAARQPAYLVVGGTARPARRGAARAAAPAGPRRPGRAAGDRARRRPAGPGRAAPGRALPPPGRRGRRRGARRCGSTCPRGRDDEVTRLGHTLNDMLAALEQAMLHERRFVDDASHELRTPLTLLRSRVQLARRRTRSVAEHEAVLDELAVDVERLIALSEQLLVLGADGAPPVRVDAAATLAAVLATALRRPRAVARRGRGRPAWSSSRTRRSSVSWTTCSTTPCCTAARRSP